MADEYNELESTIVAALKTDSFLGDSANVAEIAEKLTPSFESLYAHQFPNIGVFVTGEDAIQDIDQAYYQRGYNVVIQIACQGGYSAVLDAQLKRIMAEVVRFLNQNNREDTRLGDEDIVAIQVLSTDVSVNFEFDIASYYLGYVNCKIIKNQT